jgi:ABC-2 type transport system permease protein
MDILSTAAITGLYFVSIALLLQRFQNIGGWTVGEIAFLYGVVETVFGAMDMVFSGFDYATFGDQVRLGRFDQILLRPINVTVQVLGSQFLLRRWGRILQGVIVLGVSFGMGEVHWTLAKAAYFPIMFLSVVGLFGGLYVIGSTITFWTVQSIEAMNVFTYGGGEMMTYPMHIYQDWVRRFFTYVLPAIFLVYYPALYFLDKPDPLHMPTFAPFLAPLVGFGTLFLALRFWRYGINHYQSAGS